MEKEALRMTARRGGYIALRGLAVLTNCSVRATPSNSRDFSHAESSSHGWSDRDLYLESARRATHSGAGAATPLGEKKASRTSDQVKACLMKTEYRNLIPAAVATVSTAGHTCHAREDVFTEGSAGQDFKTALDCTDLLLARVSRERES